MVTAARFAPRFKHQVFGCVLAALFCTWTVGCSSPPSGTTDPEPKLNLESFLEAYNFYIQEKGKPPSDEQELRSFLESLPANKKSQINLPDNLDKLFVSSRDGQKFVVKYGEQPDPAGETKALAWEQTGKDGKRFVALSMGYVEEYDQASFDALTK
jgi:hypothetical protein